MLSIIPNILAFLPIAVENCIMEKCYEWTEVQGDCNIAQTLIHGSIIYKTNLFWSIPIHGYSTLPQTEAVLTRDIFYTTSRFILSNDKCTKQI